MQKYIYKISPPCVTDKAFPLSPTLLILAQTSWHLVSTTPNPQRLKNQPVAHTILTVPTAPTFSCCEKTARFGLDPSFYGIVLREVLCQNTAWERPLCCCVNFGVVFPALYSLYAHSYLQALHLQSVLIQPARRELHQPQCVLAKIQQTQSDHKNSLFLPL